jgi:hypothetical protein
MQTWRARADGDELRPTVLAQVCMAVLPVAGAGLRVSHGLRVPLGSSDDRATAAPAHPWRRRRTVTFGVDELHDGTGPSARRSPGGCPAEGPTRMGRDEETLAVSDSSSSCTSNRAAVLSTPAPGLQLEEPRSPGLRLA